MYLKTISRPERHSSPHRGEHHVAHPLLQLPCAPFLAARSVFRRGPQVPDQTEPTAKIVTAKIKLDDLSMIIVPVSINGSGPYDFMLDTGCSKTMVDQKLAEKLHLLRVGEKTVVGVLASAKMAVVHANSISIAGAVVSGGDVYSSDHLTTTGKVLGVLGEDFLKNFDVLIDYRHEVIQLESAGGSMAETAIGEHLSLELNGTYHGQPTHNRLVISGHIQELGDKPMALLLDSGANSLTAISGQPWDRAQISRRLCISAASTNGFRRQPRRARFAHSVSEVTQFRT